MEVETEEWFLKTSQSFISRDIYAARSWLLTAKSIFPQNFRLHVEEYMLEFNKKNVEECSRVLSDIFRDFSGDAVLWDEVGKLIQAVDSSSDLSRKAIFEGLPTLTQQRIILASAECGTDVTQCCKLLLVLMNKFPETISEYGMDLTEKLVDSEKKSSESGAVNHLRKLLVREVLPVICRSANLNVSHKHFYKWLQKSTEFYACYFTSESEHSSDNAWDELERLRSNVAMRCSWNVADDTKSSSLLDRMTFIRELVRKSRTDVDGVVNRKQIFYTALILLFESASKYMSHLGPSIFKGDTKYDQSYILMVDMESKEASVRTPVKKASDMNESFQTAREAWAVLHHNESFEKDFNHLVRRWKCGRWYWFQLFLCNLLVYNNEHEMALERLQQLVREFAEEKPRHEIKLRTYCHLASTSFSLGNINSACQYIFDCIPLLTHDANNVSGEFVTKLVDYSPTCGLALPFHSSSPKCPLQLLSLSTEDFLPLWVHIFIHGLCKVSLSVEDDSILGHTLVLSQHNWPKWRTQCKRILNRVAEKRSFHFELFSKYILNVDILEEVAFLKNTKACKLTISPSQTIKVPAKKSANRENDAEFWKTVKQNVQRSKENIDVILRNFLVNCKDSLIKCLNMVEPQ